MTAHARISHHCYGKSRVRLTKVARHPDRHDLEEIAVDILLEGDFEDSYRSGDNRRIVPTDTMKNTVYALAANHPLESIESFALALADHFLGRHGHVTAATIEIEKASWRRIEGEHGRRTRTPSSRRAPRGGRAACGTTAAGGGSRRASPGSPW